MLGDLAAVDSDLPAERVVLATPRVTLGEVLGTQVSRLTSRTATEVLVCPGTADRLAGHDESLIHAEPVALSDALLQVMDAPKSVQFNGFPPVSGREATGRLIDAMARVTCQLRGICWRARQRPQPRDGWSLRNAHRPAVRSL